MSDFWAGETARQAEAGNPLYGGESRDWSTTMKSLTYGEIEARLNAVLAIIAEPDTCVIDSNCRCHEIACAATGVTP